MSESTLAKRLHFHDQQWGWWRSRARCCCGWRGPWRYSLRVPAPYWQAIEDDWQAHFDEQPEEIRREARRYMVDIPATRRTP